MNIWTKLEQKSFENAKESRCETRVRKSTKIIDFGPFFGLSLSRGRTRKRTTQIDASPRRIGSSPRHIWDPAWTESGLDSQGVTRRVWKNSRFCRDPIPHVSIILLSVSSISCHSTCQCVSKREIRSSAEGQKWSPKIEHSMGKRRQKWTRNGSICCVYCLRDDTRSPL